MRLRQDSRIKQLVFISKAQALVDFKKNSPGLYKALKTTGVRGNPLPDSYTIVPMTLTDLRQIHASISRERWPGVQTVKLVPCRPPGR